MSVAETPHFSLFGRGSRARRLKLRPPFGALCEALVIVRDLKHHLLGYFVLHIISKAARFVGEFAPGLTPTRRREFVDGNHRPAHSLRRPDPPSWSDGPGLATTHGVRARHDELTPCPPSILAQQIKVTAVD